MQNYFVSNSPNSGHESRKQAWIMVRGITLDFPDCGTVALGRCPTDQNVPAQAPLLGEDVALISAGAFHTMLLKTSGAVWAVGSNDYGQLGLGPEAPDSQPTPTRKRGRGGCFLDLFARTRVAYPLATAAEVGTLGTDNVLVNAGHSHTAVVKESGAIWAAGSNANGELGLGGSEGWQCIFRQSAGNYRPVDDWVNYNAGDTSGDFSRLDTLESYRTDGKFLLKLIWPQRSGENSQIWRQTSNPVTATTGGVEGYEGKHNRLQTTGAAGLRFHTDGLCRSRRSGVHRQWLGGNFATPLTAAACIRCFTIVVFDRAWSTADQTPCSTELSTTPPVNASVDLKIFKQLPS